MRDRYPEVQISFPESSQKSDVVSLRGPREDVDKVFAYLKKLNAELVGICLKLGCLLLLLLLLFLLLIRCYCYLCSCVVVVFFVYFPFFCCSLVVFLYALILCFLLLL